MVTKIAVRVSDGAIVSTVAVTAPNDENRSNHQPPKKNDGSDDNKIAAKEKETVVEHPLDSVANNEVVDRNMSTTHVVAKTTDENKSTATGTRRSNRQKRPVVFSDDEEEDTGSNKKKRRRKQGKEKKFIIDLTGVPKQQPILRHDGKKGGVSSKYLGVHWDKSRKKWLAQIWFDGKNRHIGVYDSEGDAGADYARAVIKYNGGSDAIERLKAQQRKASQEKIDLKDVPKQQLIMKPNGKGRSTSMYKGVRLDKASNRWRAEISIDGKERHIGNYDNEEDAAADYARAVFKYNGGRDGIERRKTKQRIMASLEKIDVTDVPKQQLIMKPNGKGNSLSKYLGVTFDKASNKWVAQITIDGKKSRVGSYDNEEDAAADYARAIFKYKGGSDGMERVKAQQHSRASLEKLDLTDVPKQQLIMKPNGKGSSTSKYLGVTFDKASNNWVTQITIDGKQRRVGSYDNEEDAAADYARAVFKYNGGSDGIERRKSEQRGKTSLEKIDLTDVPKQQLIMKPNGKGSSTSKYKGVTFDKAKKKWQAHIRIDGKNRHISYYDIEEDAAADYARAVFKYKGENAEVKRQNELQQQPLNLIQVPAIPPVGYDPIKGGPISALKVTEYEI